MKSISRKFLNSIAATLFLATATLIPGPTAWCQTAIGESTGQITNNSDLMKRFSTLDRYEKKRLFCDLPGEKKRALLIHLPNEDRQLVFNCLMAEDKRWVLDQMSPQDMTALFNGLEDIEQRKIFNELNNKERQRLLKQLSPAQQSNWLMAYPELAPLVSGQPNETTKERSPEKAINKEKPSRIEKILSGDFPRDIDRRLKQFGYAFFKERKSWQTAEDMVPVSEDYPIGPGDSFTIYLWGKVEQRYPVTVNRDGGIIIPRIGSVAVAGMPVGEAKKFIRRKFQLFYTDFGMTLVMGRLRTINVFVVGQTAHPGAYRVSSMTTVIAALAQAGGPGKDGSLRDIRILRQGQPPRHIDLYDYFVFGRKPVDFRLRNGDTIFVPVIGQVAGVAGNVRRPAIYELKGVGTVRDLIDLAGGVMPFGYLQNVVVERASNNQRRVIKSFNLDPRQTSSESQLNMPVMDGDVVKVYPIHTQVNQVVYLEGHVKYPREFELKPGMRVGDILTGYDMLLPEPFTARAEIVRLVKPDLHPEIIGFDLGALLAGDNTQNIPLQDLDRIKVYSYREKAEVPTVAISGAVNAPGLYRYYPNMTVKDLIFRAGNLARRAYRQDASLSRIVPGKAKTDTTTIRFSPENAISGNQPDDMALKPNDSVYIREIPQFTLAKNRRVKLEGEFLFPGEYSFSEGERLSSVIARAGGLTSDAYAFGAVFLREDVKKIQRTRLKDYISNLEDDILTLTARSTEASLDKDEAAIITQTLTAKRQLLEKMKTAEPTGRMILDLERLMAQPQSTYDFRIEPGDRLIVSKKPDYVNVLGEVYNPTAMMVIPDKQVGYYLDRVGGPTDEANRKQIYLVKANGTVISKRQEGFFGIASWDSDQSRWSMGGFESLPVNPGDTIVVPKKVDKYSWLRLTKSVTEIMYQIAIAAGVLVVVF